MNHIGSGHSVYRVPEKFGFIVIFVSSAYLNHTFNILCEEYIVRVKISQYVDYISKTVKVEGFDLIFEEQ